MAQSFGLVLRAMSELRENKIDTKYWITWSISSAIGLFMLIGSLQGPHLCSPVVGCGVEGPMFIAIIISILLLVIRLFKKNKLKLITPLILIAFFTPSTFLFLANAL
ncbi:hypothetical protein N9I91_02305 [Candidatus Pseudothioglobus singularis]|nr:hypothetical protein [Candidatus Pseudothioglobus singularis]MDA8854968.1 hypothetical protein [Candidatus Pseudothioglobus singularis]